MRRDLLKIVADHDATTQMVILTHNIEFLFIESLLLTAARKGGNPSLTVFADAQCAAGSYVRERQQLTRAPAAVPLPGRQGSMVELTTTGLPLPR